MLYFNVRLEIHYQRVAWIIVTLIFKWNYNKQIQICIISLKKLTRAKSFIIFKFYKVNTVQDMRFASYCFILLALLQATATVSISQDSFPCCEQINQTTNEFRLASCTYQIDSENDYTFKIVYQTINDGKGAIADTLLFNVFDGKYVQNSTGQFLKSRNHYNGEIIEIQHRLESQWIVDKYEYRVYLEYLTTREAKFIFTVPLSKPSSNKISQRIS